MTMMRTESRSTGGRGSWQALTSAGVLFLAAGFTLPAHADPLDRVFGTWSGSWTTDARFDWRGPVGAPPWDPEPLTLQFHDLGVGGPGYGVLSLDVPGALVGQVTELSLVGTSLTGRILYPDEPGPNNYATLSAIFTPGSIMGRLDEAANPAPGHVHWRGTIVMVPSPGSCGLLGLGVFAAARRRR